MNTPADMSLKAEISLEVPMIQATEAMGVEAMVTVIVHLKTMAQVTIQELVTVGTGLKLNQLATTMRNSLSAWEFGSVIQRQRSTLAMAVLEIVVQIHEEIESAYNAHC